MNAALLGKKIGMTSLFTEDGKHIPCTVIEAGPCPVVQKKTPEHDGYSSVQVGYGEIAERKVSKPAMGVFVKSGVKPTRILKEFRDFEGDVAVGSNLTVEQFGVGDKVKVSGNSIGRGFRASSKDIILQVSEWHRTDSQTGKDIPVQLDSRPILRVC